MKKAAKKKAAKKVSRTGTVSRKYEPLLLVVQLNEEAAREVDIRIMNEKGKTTGTLRVSSTGLHFRPAKSKSYPSCEMTWNQLRSVQALCEA